VFRPTAGELLRGLRASLASSVLPALPPGHAARQLKAALHLLGRLEHSWDRLPAWLAADNADMQATLLRLLEYVAVQPPAVQAPYQAIRARMLAAGPAADTKPQRAFNDPSAAELAANNLQLQVNLADFEQALGQSGGAHSQLYGVCRKELAALYRRLIDRETLAWANAEQPTSTQEQVRGRT
jgi:hypothetical protein